MVGAAILLKPILHESLRIQHVTFIILVMKITKTLCLYKISYQSTM